VGLVSFSIFSLATSLPAVVFVAETCVVTLATIRTIFIARGWKSLAALLGFFEVSIWLFAIAQVMQHLNNLGCFLAFAGGFSLGNYLGVLIEQKLALGHVVVQVVSPKQDSSIADNLKWAGFGVTVLEAGGANGPVRAVFTVVSRRELGMVTSIIRRHDPKAYYSVGDLRSVFHAGNQGKTGLASVLPSFFHGIGRILPGLNRMEAPVAITMPGSAFQDPE
jgi:uncharacterized protein YebE (UPF0316 family)